MKNSNSLKVLTPEITASYHAWNKLLAYSECKVKDRRIEISGLGIAIQDSPRSFHIKDFFLVPSEGSGATTSFKNDGTAALAMEILEGPHPEDAANLKVWWHTHPGMGVQWSSQDTKQMEDFGEEGYPWLISIVTDGKGVYRARLDIFERMGGLRVYFDNIRIKVEENPDHQSLRSQLQEEVDEKVEIKPTPIYKKKGHPSQRRFPVTDHRRFGHNGHGYRQELLRKRAELSRRDEILDDDKLWEGVDQGVFDENDPEFSERMRELELIEELEEIEKDQSFINKMTFPKGFFKKASGHSDEED